MGNQQNLRERNFKHAVEHVTPPNAFNFLFLDAAAALYFFWSFINCAHIRYVQLTRSTPYTTTDALIHSRFFWKNKWRFIGLTRFAFEVRFADYFEYLMVFFFVVVGACLIVRNQYRSQANHSGFWSIRAAYRHFELNNVFYNKIPHLLAISINYTTNWGGQWTDWSRRGWIQSGTIHFMRNKSEALYLWQRS